MTDKETTDVGPWNGVETLTDLEARTETGTYLGTSRHTDADSIRRHYGIRRFDAGDYDWKSVVPGMLMHAKDNSAYSPAGGTSFLCIGSYGAGKSTMAHTVAVQVLDVNSHLNEMGVWRASESRSEWVRFAPWARVYVPRSCEVEARIVSTDEANPYEREVDLEDVVREVVAYEDVHDLNQNVLEPGKFHVVYPDPDFRKCQEIYRRSSKEYDLTFEPGDPVQQWWVSWVQDRVENGPYTFTSAFLDEIHEIISQEVSKDAFDSYQKVQLYRDCHIDARKFNLSLFQWGQDATDVHEKLRRKERWRITMNGRANPTRSSQVVGWDSIPMNTDLASRMKTGQALAYTQTNFEPFTWPDIPKPTDEELKVRLRPKQENARDSVAAEGGGVA
ncbi:ATP-binding protein [Halobacterium wangiae]|uniref:ATP-binding protein n=1 Tax=Halobacterium wangiae TaxID=2902623 RepID=UPI001E3B25D8|nr:ATP-binding protein [Halobacterium wangiae]